MSTRGKPRAPARRGRPALRDGSHRNCSPGLRRPAAPCPAIQGFGTTLRWWFRPGALDGRGLPLLSATRVHPTRKLCHACCAPSPGSGGTTLHAPIRGLNTHGRRQPPHNHETGAGPEVAGLPALRKVMGSGGGTKIGLQVAAGVLSRDRCVSWRRPATRTAALVYVKAGGARFDHMQRSFSIVPSVMLSSFIRQKRASDVSLWTAGKDRCLRQALRTAMAKS